MSRFSRLVLTLGVSLCLTPPQLAQAEHCWMVGCDGMIGYIYVPASGIYPYLIDQPDCPQSAVFRPFQTKGLPDVNSVVATGDVELLSEEYIEGHLADFPFVNCLTKTPLPGPDNHPIQGNDLRQGSKVKILGYRTYLSLAPTKPLLFALVQVINDNP